MMTNGVNMAVVRKSTKTITLSDGSKLTARQIMDVKKCSCAYAHKCMSAYTSKTMTEPELLSVAIKRLYDKSLVKTVRLRDGTTYTVAQICKIKGCGNAYARTVMDKYDDCKITETSLLARVNSRFKTATEWDGLKCQPRLGNMETPEPTELDRMYGMGSENIQQEENQC